ncbi:cyclin dependent kinase binding protein [Babesia ovis]|uniref:Cyclin dependent kinase binding protein n=1 Tax=Babesia ovis TaxID=5869 RepID=A0A9W5TER8_BABOV|nr:cyclin dependent kinase binding protein [Babesia ovis]
MRRNTSQLDEYSLGEFQELITDLRFTSLKTANLSTNVAVAFLTGIPRVKPKESAVNVSSSPNDSETYASRTPHEGYPLDQDHIIELEEERLDQQLAADEGEAARRAHDERQARTLAHEHASMSLRMRISSWFSRLSRRLRRYCDRHSDILKNKSDHSMGIEERESQSRKKFYISYAELIVPSQDTYDPNFMDIPVIYAILKARSCGSLTFPIPEHLESYTSVAAEITNLNELNARFSSSNEWLHPSLSLTKLSRIKLMLYMAPHYVTHLDPSTVFSAWILFERLLIKGVVTKPNRKLYAATSLVLAYKFNQDGENIVINEIIAYLCRDRSITARAIFAAEMKVFRQLEFSLKQSYSGMRRHVQDYLDFRDITFMDLYETPESTYLELDNPKA